MKATATPHRRVGIEYIEDVPWGTHIASFYGGEQDLLGVTAEYFRAGLEDEEQCLWIVSTSSDAEKAAGALKKHVPGLEGLLERGQMNILTHSQWYVKSGVFSGENVLDAWMKVSGRAVSLGYSGLRILGDTSWLQRGLWKEWIAYEAAVNAAIPDLKMIALCTYSLEMCDRRQVIDIVGNHHLSLVKANGCVAGAALAHSGVPHEAVRLAHEVRNPLAVIKGFLQLLMDKDGLRQYRKEFSLAIQEADRIDEAVNRLVEGMRDGGRLSVPSDLEKFMVSRGLAW